MPLVDFFDYLACVTFCLFSLPLGVRDWLWLVTVALPGLLFIDPSNLYLHNFFFISESHFFITILRYVISGVFGLFFTLNSVSTLVNLGAFKTFSRSSSDYDSSVHGVEAVSIDRL